MNYSEVATPFGAIGVHWDGDRLLRILLAPALSAPTPSRTQASGPATRPGGCRTSSPAGRPAGSPPGAPQDLPAPRWIRDELEAYFADPEHPIDCPVATAGSAFQRRVWDRIAAIPSGVTATYGAIAAELGSSARAVGNACRANPVPLCVPCHRVVAAKGLGGFAGDRSGRLVQIKHWLLTHEASVGRAAGCQS